MSDWKWAMLAILPFVVAWRLRLGGWLLPLPQSWSATKDWLFEPRARTWLAMAGASLAAALVDLAGWRASWTDHSANVELMAWYIAIDGIAGAFILRGYRREGACLGQFIIVLSFAWMVMSHVGFILAANPSAIGEYLTTQIRVGWVQFAILLLWGTGDVGGSIYRRVRPSDRLPAYNKRAS